MKYFIDLGMYDTRTIVSAIEIFPDFDGYIGFEPVPKLYRILNKEILKIYKDSNPELLKKIKLFNLAASNIDSDSAKLYIGKSKKKSIGISEGSTLRDDKTSGGLDASRFKLVNSIDFSKYIMNNFSKDDYIILKVDIEGEEYSMFEHMINDGSIKYIDKLFCEWHYKKINGVSEAQHNNIVKRLNENGIEVTGDNSKDDFSIVYNIE